LLSFPPRWYFDILRALDYFRAAGVPYDPRMVNALEVLHKKRRAGGVWPLQGKHPGAVHFEMEPVGKPSRWNTLRALRVSRMYERIAMMIDTKDWTIFERSDWSVTLRYPDPTPTGCPVRIHERIQETGHRFHFVSEGSDEVYFEIGRYPENSVEHVKAVFIEDVTDRIEGIEVGAPEQATIAGRSATRFEIRWPGKRRLIHLLGVDGVTHRVILDPDSELNLEILDSLRYE